MSSSSVEQTVPSTRRPRVRKSIAHLPSQQGSIDAEDKENVGGDIGPEAQSNSATAPTIASSKKSRSKSLGPGGLDALREDAGNRSKVSSVAPKSILKPSIPLSPLKEIPSRKVGTPEKKTSSPTKSPRSNVKSPQKSAEQLSKKTTTTSSPTVTPSKKTAVHQEAGQDEINAKEIERETVKRQREARRKSLANRRVSFAPEATLHTWDVVEYMQDATTSSTSNDSTRRASSASQFQNSTNSDPDDPPSTPPEQVEESPRKKSPAHQRDLHQKKRRRRSSGGPPVNFNHPNDVWSSSPYSGSSVGGSDEAGPSPERSEKRAGSAGALYTEPDAHGQENEDVAPDVDIVGSPSFNASVNHNVAQYEVDQDGDVTMEMAGDEITGAFQPWTQRDSSRSTGQEALRDRDSASAVLPTFAPRSPGAELTQADLSMDMTQAVGGIMQGQQKDKSSRKSIERRRSEMSRRRSSGDGSSYGDETMDFTTAIGSIEHGKTLDTSSNELEQNEELSMEFTSVFGGIRKQPSNGAQQEQARNDIGEVDLDGEMEMTTTIGGIQHVPSVFDSEDATKAMDMTMAVGGIVADKDQVKDVVAASSPLRSERSNKTRPAVLTSETGSPSISTISQAGSNRKQASVASSSTPTKAPGTPTRQITPKPERPTTPGKTPPSKNITMRNPSPKKLFQAEIKGQRKSPNAPAIQLFQVADNSRQQTPKVVLAPRYPTNRRVSGVGMDKEGLGSPQVAAKLDRRGSITDQADLFAPQDLQSRGVRFEDPRAMAAEVSRHREEDERRESGQFIMEQEANPEHDEKDVTATLKDMIEKMTPKRNNVKGRKSFGVGSGKGLLGKRPAELDDDDEDGTPTSLKGRQTSPVKKIRLQGPPTKLQTTGKPTLVPTSGNSRPSTPRSDPAVPDKTASTPKDQGRFIDAEASSSAQKPMPALGDQGVSMLSTEVEDKISLQDFLNLTNIRFMELNTTKRRHTVAPGSAKKGTSNTNSATADTDPLKYFEDCVVAGACTVPMLELFQHSCRELKKYIAEGRNIIREIEADTLDENPPLFRAYQSTSLQERQVMDNQFKNMKFNARLLSKGMWYEWRMKLLDGLKEGLNSVASGMEDDGSLISEQEEAIKSILPAVIEEHAQLRKQCSELRARASELADCDQEELKDARLELMSVQEEIGSNQRKIEQSLGREEEARTAIEDANEAKAERVQSIKEAHRVREECRGWSTSEVASLKGDVDALESRYGWAITSASSTALTMTYRQQLQLFFDVASFLPNASQSNAAKGDNSIISLTYVGDAHELHPLPLTTERRFFLQLMQAHLHGMPQAETRVKDMLQFVSNTWDKACAIEAQVHRLNTEFMTNSSIASDDRLIVKGSVLLHDIKTKVEIGFDVVTVTKESQIGLKVASSARVVYGERFREDKMNQFLRGKVAGLTVDDAAAWADVARDLKKRLVNGGKKL